MDTSPILVFLGQAAILIALPYLLWRHTPVRFLAPLVVVQILVGIGLGPSLLGQAFPALASVLLQGERLAALSGLAALAVVMFAFLTGLHFDAAEITGRQGGFFATALSSILVPAALGVAGGLLLFDAAPALAGRNASRWLFAVGVGVALAVTALPVLAAILRETGLLGERIGRDALGLAAVNDLMLWIMLAAVVSATHANASAGELLLLRVVLAMGYLAVMFIVVRPLARRRLRRLIETQESGEGELVAVVALTLASAWITESLGFHYILGAFIAGVILPPACAAPLIRQIEPYIVVVLLPFFFILTGLRIDLKPGGEGFALAFWIGTAIAVVGKMLGTLVPARLAGASWRDSWRLGTLMQCKGLLDVVVLSVLLDAGILAPAAFSALVLMAVATTAATKPMLMLIDRLSLPRKRP